MTHRRLAIAFFALLTMLILGAPAMAQNVRTFAVLPFKYNGPDKFKYFPNAFQASLNSDLEWLGHVEPTSQDLSKITAPRDKADAVNMIKSLGVDYLISGTISVLNKDATLEINAVNSEGTAWKQKGQMEIDQITPWLDTQSRTIMGDVFLRPGYSSSEKTKPNVAKAQSNAPTNAGFITATGAQTGAQALNPQFRYEGGTENIGRWRSQTMRFSSYSMLVTDGDGDGKNEVFILQKAAISAYRFREGRLEHLSTFELGANLTNIRLEGADLDRDGIPELVVGAYQYQSAAGATQAPNGSPRSCILSFEGGKFKYLVERYPRFLGVLRLPPAYTPILVAQKKGRRNLFDRHITEAYFKGDSIEIGQNIQTPEYGNIYNMTYIPQEMGYNYVVLNNKRKLVTYSQTLERLYQSDSSYNSSGVAINYADIMLGMGPGKTQEQRIVYNIPIRMIAANITSQTKAELLVNKDLSAMAQLFQGYKYFTQGEIHAMVWDGVGLNLSWKTRRIKGQVADIGLVDLNNDGKKQLCVLINTFAGIGYGNRKTVVLAYDLQQ